MNKNIYTVQAMLYLLAISPLVIFAGYKKMNLNNSDLMFNVINHEITFSNSKDGITLSGTLSVPDTHKKPTVVILVSGMGANDRDYTMMGHKLFLDAADYFTQRGIAVLRYDKRGVGKSTGVYDMTCTSTDLGGDVVAAVEFLKNRDDIDMHNIGLAGHSEGGLISFIVASQSPDIAFVVSLAGAMVNDIDGVLHQIAGQLRADGATDEFIAFDRIIRKQILQAITMLSIDDAQAQLLPLVKAYLDGMTDEQKAEAATLPFAITEQKYQHTLGFYNSVWNRYYLHVDVLNLLSTITVPVLAINGTLDFITDVQLALSKIEQGLQVAGNHDVTVVAIPNQNHWFQECKTGALAEYGVIQETMHESTLELITDWILKKSPTIHVSSSTVLLDEPVEISVLNLTAHEQIEIEVLCKDKSNKVWVSRATFQADDSGMVNVAMQAPLSGSYSGMDAIGLFWSMECTNKEFPYFVWNEQELQTHISVYSQDKLRTQITIHRLLALPEIEKRDVREHGLVGTFFYPKSMKKGPGVIVIPASVGGIPETLAKLLASRGYAVLALGFFGLDGLPANLENIPLEYFQKAMQWFKEQPQVDPNNVAILGQSKGAELALLWAATLPDEMNAVIAYVPSSFVYGGSPNLNQVNWTYKSLPIPFMPHITDDLATPHHEEVINATEQGTIPFHANTFEDPFDFASIYRLGITQFPENVEGATIPVENITCPILMLSGQDDKIWPSTLYGNRIMDRLDAKKSQIKRQHLHFSEAGHGFLYPYGPSTSQPFYFPGEDFWYTLGGTAKGDGRAAKESWQAVLSFLEESLSKNDSQINNL